MSHITIIINRGPHPPTGGAAVVSEPEECTASVTYPVPHGATDSEVAQAVKKLVKQVREFGN